MREWILGRNPVYEVLRARRRQPFRRRLARNAEEKDRLAQILRLCAERKISVERVSRGELDSLGPNHQGVALEASGYPYRSLDEALEIAVRRGEPPFFLILDALQDPQNLGTLLRTAEAVGVHGVLLPLAHTATITPAVVHASSGASEHLRVIQVNLTQAIARLKKANLWVIGLESTPSALLPDQVHMEGPLALVVGSEGRGMRQLVRDSCDLLLRLPMRGQVGSLNAAVAGSIALYLAFHARSGSG
jgi:23S rRNA (guanosine2251-2'-O)-methyltransferase